jgi:hypothetical protein
MEQIKQEFIKNCVQEDIALYFALHPDITPDLFDHCAVMTDELTQDYQIIY